VDRGFIEKELIELLKTTSQEFAVIKNNHEHCSSRMVNELNRLESIVHRKFDKKDGEEVISQLNKIKSILNLDNSTRVKNGIGFMTEVVNIILIIIGMLSVAIGIIVGIIKIIGGI
jgi:hypothetical protein